MRVAVMQPYFFPYIGYIQLMHAVDVFVFLDDVNYINKGWINRNQILVNGTPSLFTIPLKEASQNRIINEIDHNIDEKWKSKFLKTIEMNYRNSSFFNQGYELIEKVINSDYLKIADLIFYSFVELSAHLKFSTKLMRSSEILLQSQYKGQERIVEICKIVGGRTYINPPNGRELYSKDLFAQSSISLKFIQPNFLSYPQIAKEFISGLSFIDVIMNNSYSFISEKLLSYEIID